MFYLATHSTHFIYSYMVSRHMVKDHSDSKKGNLLLPHRLLFPINSKGSLYAPSHRQDSTYHSLCYTSRGALAGTRNSLMGPPHEGSIRRPIAPHIFGDWLYSWLTNQTLWQCDRSCVVFSTVQQNVISNYHIPAILKKYFLNDTRKKIAAVGRSSYLMLNKYISDN